VRNKQAGLDSRTRSRRNKRTSTNERRSRSRASSKREEPFLRMLLLCPSSLREDRSCERQWWLRVVGRPVLSHGPGSDEKGKREKHPGRLLWSSSSQVCATSPIDKISRKKRHGQTRKCHSWESAFVRQVIPLQRGLYPSASCQLAHSQGP
jgi:hypothetical protein